MGFIVTTCRWNPTGWSAPVTSAALPSSTLKQLHALAYNLATFFRCIELPEAMAD